MPRIEGRRPAPGFAYLWVLLLVALLGIGLTVVAEVDATASRRERERELLAIGRQFQMALARYAQGRPRNQAQDQPQDQAQGPAQLQGQLQGQGMDRNDYPATLEDLLQDSRAPGIRRHLRKVFIDPMTGKAEWGLVQLAGRIVGVHSLSEDKPIKQDGFEAEQAGLRGKQTYAEWLFVYPPDLMINGQTAPTSPVPKEQTK